MRTHANTELVYRAKVTRRWTREDGTVDTYTAYFGVYVRPGDAQRAGTREASYWKFRDDIEVEVEIESSTLDWKKVAA